MRTFTSLPDDVLFHIFSFLTLRNVLQLEHLSQRLYQAVSSYLSTLKSLNFYHHHIKHDIFRQYEPHVVPLPLKALSNLLRRCPLARSIAYLPPHLSNSHCSPSYSTQETLKTATCHTSITEVEFIDSTTFMEAVQHVDGHIAFLEVNVSSFSRAHPDPISRYFLFGNISMLHLEDALIDFQTLSYFSASVEIALIRCKLYPVVMGIGGLNFPNVRKFCCVGNFGHLGELIGIIVKSKVLKSLQLGLVDFIVLETALSNWKAMEFEDLFISSYHHISLASLQQYASIVANICRKCKDTLRRICLPSTILVKQFFEQLISQGVSFRQLKSLEMTGLADTKMYFDPGNMVKTYHYRKFLKLCPEISSLSLHSFTGSLSALALPLTLTELVLPWDNRHLDTQQQSSILNIQSCLAILPLLRSLSIFAVQEINTLRDSVRYFNQLPSLKISLKKLHTFKLKNVCLSRLDLTACTNLTSFTIHWCPTDLNLKLPVESLERVFIYDDNRHYIERLVKDFTLMKKSWYSEPHTCHIHIQLHSILVKDHKDKIEHVNKAGELFSVIEKQCGDMTGELDFLILKDDILHVFDHNSGEQMYPFTEFLSENYVGSVRSIYERRLVEEARRTRILEGLSRWKRCIMDMKLLNSIPLPCSDHPHPSPLLSCSLFEFCDSEFSCACSLPYLIIINSISRLCQPSGVKSSKETSLEQPSAVKSSKEASKEQPFEVESSKETSKEQPSGVKSSKETSKQGSCDNRHIVDLNVPLIHSHARDYLNHSFSRTELEQLNVNSNPLILVSIIAYAHEID